MPGKTYTDAQLIEMGKKAAERAEKDARKAKAISQATRKLIDAHPDEYEDYLANSKKALGV